MKKSLMVQSTSLGAGKSYVSMGLLRAFKNEGKKVAPFNMQTVTDKVVVTNEGYIISENIIKNAEAASIKPEPRMNPLLLIPKNEEETEIILNGKSFCVINNKNFSKVIKTLEYYVDSAKDSLEQDFDLVIVEGDNNFKITNEHTNVLKELYMPTILVGDYLQPNAIGALKSYIDLLDDRMQNNVKGVIINKFTADENVYLKMLQDKNEYLGKKIIGYLPYDKDFKKNLENKMKEHKKIVNISVIALKEATNLEDLDGFANDYVNIKYIKNFVDLKNSDLIILPDTRDCIKDLNYLREQNFEEKLREYLKKDIPIIGLNGGFKILSKKIIDENKNKIDALNLIDIEVFANRNVEAKSLSGNLPKVEGIFKGLTNQEFEGTACGRNSLFFSKDNVYGTFINKLFQKKSLTKIILDSLIKKKNIINSLEDVNRNVNKDKAYDELALLFAEKIDLNYIKSFVIS